MSMALCQTNQTWERLRMVKMKFKKVFELYIKWIDETSLWFFIFIAVVTFSMIILVGIITKSIGIVIPSINIITNFVQEGINKLLSAVTSILIGFKITIMVLKKIPEAKHG